MAETVDRDFIRLLNENMGIAVKISRLYFNGCNLDREDALQEMMFQLWKSYPQFKRGSKFSTWMYSVCLNTALTFRRKQSKSDTISIDEEHERLASPSQETGFEDELNRLNLAISTLSPVNKAVILLYLDEMSYDEIASVIGISRSNVSVRLVRIKKELELKMKPF
ncbi:sigma-70 family RNA polymerase sigma factor [Algoriphagus terrigena]|uniref:sigma-70 family RNA polymerase sigma factor n=1 Tax=Algoriphagus terrigena TaxID=344884 RepID=UPI00047A6DDC|nr:sigma-70 family RNA polymerase sigma factor [Algoriphagus terrigena]